MLKRPQIDLTESRQILEANKVTDKVALIGIRGYYPNSYGKRGANDRNVYDDAIIIVSPERYETFRANTDPSIYRQGVATLKTGVHRYYKGKHKGLYWALRLVGEQAPVTRDGEKGDKIGIALNIHRGGSRTTGSLGCQTLPSGDWDEFIEIVYDEMKRCGQKTIPYVLIEEADRRAGVFRMPTAHERFLSEREIDNLLIRFDDNETVARIPSDKPSPNPAEVQPKREPVKLPVPDISAEQPLQNIFKESVAYVPSLDGVIGKAHETVFETTAKIEKAVETAQKAKDAIDNLKILKDVIDSRSDGKKSLWSTILQAVYQAVWAVFAFFLGLPKEVWLVVALIVGIIGIFYLYRQISLGKMRETARLKLIEIADFLK